MTRASRGVWGIVALAVSMAACGDDEAKDADVTSRCSSACAVAQVDCHLDAADTHLCERRCVTRFSSYPAACFKEATVALNCTVDTREWSCYAGVEPILCSWEMTDYKLCLVKEMPSPKSAYCAKCKSCYLEDPSFSASLCSPFWDGSSFVVTSCATDGDITRIGDKMLSEQAIESMDCASFAERL